MRSLCYRQYCDVVLVRHERGTWALSPSVSVPGDLNYVAAASPVWSFMILADIRHQPTLIFQKGLQPLPTARAHDQLMILPWQ